MSRCLAENLHCQQVFKIAGHRPLESHTSVTYCQRRRLCLIVLSLRGRLREGVPMAAPLTQHFFFFGLRKYERSRVKIGFEESQTFKKDPNSARKITNNNPGSAPGTFEVGKKKLEFKEIEMCGASFNATSICQTMPRNLTIIVNSIHVQSRVTQIFLFVRGLQDKTIVIVQL